MTRSADMVGVPDRRLTALGIPADDEHLYRALLIRPRATVAELAAATGWETARVRRRIRSLEQREMLTRLTGRPLRFSPAPPDAVVEVLALQRREEIERARLAAAVLGDEFRLAARRADEGPALHLLSGRERVARKVALIQRSAQEELLVLDRPPYAVPFERAQGEVRRRTVHDHRAVERPARCEESRTLDDVPLNLVIADRRIALVALDPSGDALVLHPSALLDGLVALHGLLWERSLPLWPERSRPTDELSAEDAHLLTLSASGLTDQAIARRLGVAQRTVERRMRRIMDVLGARTRFQAGLRAAHRGVITAGCSDRGTYPHHW
ncbi:helix-turn-helix domain-containing protein [Streptomyces albipurpureus]|uniref:LuxR C-terminal-related transcriptional regulator n=1 Tax=Streptomyces albipurpureus TaxID=2897419 RepID=A0ABT0US62_9ACTN|nr:LuxR family transcriptional regulator [Streptomyces sp. CWNU-1]MCM2391398.1 LuxR C-terminal-related transcriptional regulator [Streptomyces sp. CWNU-1]